MDQPEPILRLSHVEYVDGIEELVIRHPRRIVTNVFLCLWMILWTAGCGAGVFGLTQVGMEPGLVVFLTFLIVSWLVVAAVTSWQLVGVELIRIEGNRLVHAVRGPGWRRQRVYQITEIAELSSDAGPPLSERGNIDNPPLSFSRSGVVKFSHRGKPVRLGVGQDEAEGRAILAWLAQRLPRSAIATVS